MKMEKSGMSPSGFPDGLSSPAYPTLYYGRIILGEIPPLLSAMKKTIPRWSSNHQSEDGPLIQQLRNLQRTIMHLPADGYLEPNSFLHPFLAVIRSEDTTGPVTKSALAAVNRMLNYGLVDPRHSSAAAAVESVAAAVTHARFVGTDQGADEVVLWEILTVLRTLILSPVGHLLNNESVCEILNSSFRICFETRLSELLRNCAEDTLRHMVQLLFARLPQFKDESQSCRDSNLKMGAGATHSSAFGEKELKKRHSLGQVSLKPDVKQEEVIPLDEPGTEVPEKEATIDLATVSKSSSVESGLAEEISPEPEEEDEEGGHLDISHTHLAPESSEEEKTPMIEVRNGEEVKEPPPPEDPVNINDPEADDIQSKEEFTNLQGVKFTVEASGSEGKVLLPYSLPCVREVFRFLISLTSPTNSQNTPTMIHTALNLLTVALEVGAEHINHIPALLTLVKNNLCRNIFMLIKVDAKLPIFMTSLRMSILLFESLRIHLKFQLETFVGKLTSIISSESPNVSYFYKELSLETIVQLWRIPGLITELFLNYDCNLYSSNVFEDLTKILSKNAFPVQGLYSTNLLSLEALLTVIEIIDSHCPPQLRKKRKGFEDGDYQKQDLNDGTRIAASVVPTSSGYLLGLQLLQGETLSTPVLKARPHLVGEGRVCREALLAVKEKKKLLALGTDQFNVKPDKGVQFLQENNVIEQTTEAIALFLKENPHLDKKVIGEYVSKKKNVAILSAFVRSFDFRGLRIDECLRNFLEAFRLPGEAPLISIIIEHFSSHWHTSNDCPFEKEDAAFTLAYAVIMLNVDQHNQNAKKQNIPMTLDQFRNNLRGVNNGKDFEQKMLADIYYAIRNEEIVMPAEQTGFVRENYVWKQTLKRGKSKEGYYVLTDKSHSFDKDLFFLCWGPTIASLSYVFDKSNDESFLQKSISGFRKCAAIAARFGMSDVYDNLVVSLIKFTGLTLSLGEVPEQVAISFGENPKAQLAAKTVFGLVTAHGDNVRDGWKNIVDLLLRLFRCRLLSATLVESEDFVEPSGKVQLLIESPSLTNQSKVESGIFSSLYSYISLGDPSSPKSGFTPEEVEMTERAKRCIEECHPEKLLTESAFLRYDSLNELLKALIGAGDANSMEGLAITATMKPQSGHSSGSPKEAPPPGLDEYSQAFLLELVVSVLIANKDRAGGVWPTVRDHIYSLLMGAAAAERFFLLERCVVAILRIAKVLLRRPELANPILQSLRMLLLLRPRVLRNTALQIVSGIHEVLSVNADHIQEPPDWAILFALLECSGAGAKPPKIVSHEAYYQDFPPNSQGGDGEPLRRADSGQSVESCGTPPSLEGEGLDEEEEEEEGRAECPGSPVIPPTTTQGKVSRGPSPETIQNPGGWILVGKEGEIEPVPMKSVTVNEWDIVPRRGLPLGEHSLPALLRAADTLCFLVRERHVTASSLPYAVQTVRTFVEATLNGGNSNNNNNNNNNKNNNSSNVSPAEVDKRASTRRGVRGGRSKGGGPPQASSGSESGVSTPDEEEVTNSAYQQVSEKLLDLMDTLHTSSSQILNMRDREEGEEGGGTPSPLRAQSAATSALLWQQSLCPLLQGIARYCCDSRPSIRNLALTYLQRALLNHDLQTLTPSEWEGCFNKVLFPLLAKLLLLQGGAGAMEETRVRAATLVQKVYLRHLTPLLSLPTFTALWLTILDFMDKFLHTHKSDHLNDAIPEILKNMLLVMETTQVFHTAEGFTHLWSITWDRIDAFLPNFRHELFRSHPPTEIHRIEVVPSELPQAVGASAAAPPQGPSQPQQPPSRDVPAPPRGEQEGLEASPSRREGDAETVQLKEQAAVRLSLSQETLPYGIGSSFILQPPLPQLLPPAASSSSPSSPPPAASPVPVSPFQHRSNLLHQEGAFTLSSLPRLVPAPTEQQQDPPELGRVPLPRGNPSGAEGNLSDGGSPHGSPERSRAPFSYPWPLNFMAGSPSSGVPGTPSEPASGCTSPITAPIESAVGGSATGQEARGSAPSGADLPVSVEPRSSATPVSSGQEAPAPCCGGSSPPAGDFIQGRRTEEEGIQPDSPREGFRPASVLFENSTGAFPVCSTSEFYSAESASRSFESFADTGTDNLIKTVCDGV